MGPQRGKAVASHGLPEGAAGKADATRAEPVLDKALTPNTIELSTAMESRGTAQKAVEEGASTAPEAGDVQDRYGLPARSLPVGPRSTQQCAALSEMGRFGQ